MIDKFEEMLHDMYGKGYEDMIDVFMYDLHDHYGEEPHLDLDKLFIEFGKYLEDCEIMRAAFGQK